MNKTRLWRLLALFSVFALFVAAFGDDDDEPYHDTYRKIIG